MNGPKATSALSPFDSQLRTLIGAARRSHSCHKPTYAVQQTASLFDHFVGAGDECQWQRDTERICRLQIDDQLEFRWLLHRQVGRFFAPENTTCIDTDLAEG